MSSSNRPRRRVPAGGEEEINISVGPRADTGGDDTPPSASTAEPEMSEPETQKSGLAPGNPENRKTGKPETPMGTVEPAVVTDYLGATYGGITDPDDDFHKASTSLPLYLWKAAKAIAPLEGMTAQELFAAILRGDKPSLRTMHPDIVTKFYTMAQQGKLRR